MSDKQAHYLVTLKSVQPYFFGGENMHETGNKRDFFVKSTRFPQQTALLGMLRHYLLLHHGLIDAGNKLTDRKKASEIIGPKSFCKGEKREFGVIKKLSPVGLLHQGSLYYSAPMDYSLRWEPVDVSTRMWRSRKSDEKESPLKQILYDPTYDSKEGMPDLLVDVREELIYDEKKPVFKALTRPGIVKSREGRVADQEYYRQQYYQLREDCSFGFYLTTDSSTDLDGLSDLMLMGGEQSPFRIEFVRKQKKPQEGKMIHYPSANTLPEGWVRLVLLSDTYVDQKDDLVRQAEFAMNNMVSFRSIASVTYTSDQNERHTEYFHNVVPKERKASHGGKSHAVMSRQYFLYARGSVFYYRNKDTANNQLKRIHDQEEFYTIGYNHAVILN